MKLTCTFPKLAKSILVVTLLFSLKTSPVLADDAATPEPPVSEEATVEPMQETVENTPEPQPAEEKPVQESDPAAQATQEPTHAIGSKAAPEETQDVKNTVEATQPALFADENPAETDDIQATAEETQSAETPTVTKGAAADPEISELLNAAEEAGVELIPLNEEDEISPLGSNDAVEIFSSGDPYFQDPSGNWIGYTGLGGTCPAIVTTCNQVATPIQAAIDAAQVNATIYVEQDTYVQDIVINKSLTLTGLWQGNEDYADRPTLQGSVLITADNVAFQNWVVDAIGKSYGIEIQGNDVMINSSLVSNATIANIFVNGADNAIIANNTIENSHTGDGILVLDADNTDIELNEINNNGNVSVASDGGIHLAGATSNTILYDNNITNNNYGIINTTGTQVDARDNYLNGNSTNTLGDVLINTSYPMVSLPYDWGFPPAPGSTLPDDEISPPADGFVEYDYPIDGDYSELDCGMVWDANTEINTEGVFQRYVNDVWIRYDANLNGWVHDMGQEENVQHLRKPDGSWHLIDSNGTMSAMPNITDNNWSVLDGNWCLNPTGGHLMYEDCFLYYYENGNFIWALSTQDGSYYDYDSTTSSWTERN
jgi:hypothetical protein